MTVINTNIGAMRAQNGSRVANQSLQTAMERLSTGKRINSAKDDAAGLAIASRMTSQVKGLAVAIRNANDGISMAQSAEGALGEVTNMLQRMRELAVQASNGTNSVSDRETLQAEMNQLTQEVDATSKATTYNGINLLDGSAKNVNLQVGSRAGDTLSFSIDSVSSKSLGLQGFKVEGQLTTGRVGAVGGMAKDDVLINGKAAFAAAVPAGTTDTAAMLATALNANTGQTGVKATAYNTLTGAAPNANSFAAGDLTVNGASIGAASSVEEFVANINRDAPGVNAVLNDNGTISLSNDTGKDIVIAGAGAAKAGFAAATYSGFVAVNSTDGSSPITVSAKAGGAAANVQKLGLNGTDGSTFTGASVSNTPFSVSEDVKINGVAVGKSNDASAASKAAAINAISSKTGVTATATTTAKLSIDLAKAVDGKTFSINGATITIAGTGAASAVSLADVVGNINGTVPAGGSGVPGVVASTDADGNLILTSTSGLDIAVADLDSNGFVTQVQSDDGSAAAAVAATSTAATPPVATTVRGRITLSSEGGSAINIEGANTAQFGMSKQGGTNDVVGGGLSILTAANAKVALKAIDKAIDKVSATRGDLGAIQNRLDTRVNVLTSSQTNITEARSRIEDTDFSAETTNLAKAQILSQAATAMLAQANQSAQGVLSLLR